MDTKIVGKKIITFNSSKKEYKDNSLVTKKDLEQLETNVINKLTSRIFMTVIILDTILFGLIQIAK